MVVIMIDKILIKHIHDNVPDKEVALLLSGGVDSISVGFSAHRLGKKITAYSFKTDLHDSYDYSKAEEVADIMGWNFVGTTIPTDNLKEDFFLLLDEYGCEKKTHFECIYPFIYIYPQIKEKYVLSGWAADGYFGLSKKAVINYSQTLELLNQFRDDYFKDENRAGYDKHDNLAKMYGKEFICPYLCNEAKSYFQNKNWQELNKPQQKYPVRLAFDKEFSLIGKVKKHANLQLESKINNVFEYLLDDEQINFKARSRIMDICRDWVTRRKTSEIFVDM